MNKKILIIILLTHFTNSNGFFSVWAGLAGGAASAFGMSLCVNKNKKHYPEIIGLTYFVSGTLIGMGFRPARRQLRLIHAKNLIKSLKKSNNLTSAKSQDKIYKAFTIIGSDFSKEAEKLRDELVKLKK